LYFSLTVVFEGTERIERVCEMTDSLLSIVREIKAIIQKSRVLVPDQCDLEISHHYGLERFREVGMTAVTVVNREYSKRILILLPGQRHPEQWHRERDETLHVLYGEVLISLDGVESCYQVNDVLTIPRGTKHALRTARGAVIEEISSDYGSKDSFYSDPSIMAERKTCVPCWMDTE